MACGGHSAAQGSRAASGDATLARAYIETHPQTDVWSAGCVLYEMVALKPPFEAPSLRALISKVRRAPAGRHSTTRVTRGVRSRHLRSARAASLPPAAAALADAGFPRNRRPLETSQRKPRQIIKGSYTPLPARCSPELRALVAALLTLDPIRRPSIQEVRAWLHQV